MRVLIFLTALHVASFRPVTGCPGVCVCPGVTPSCPPGVSVLLDGCGCCRVCSAQLGGACSQTRPCDHHKGLECNYGNDVGRTHGICRAKEDGRSCEYSGRMYQSGESFSAGCKHQCTCIDGAVGCIPLCPTLLPLATPSCPAPRLLKAPGQCCLSLACHGDSSPHNTTPQTPAYLPFPFPSYPKPHTKPYPKPYSKINTKPYPKPYSKINTKPYPKPYSKVHTKPYPKPYSKINTKPYPKPCSKHYIKPYSKPYRSPPKVALGNELVEAWPAWEQRSGQMAAWRQVGDQCVVQTTSWSQCSRSCGMGVSSRVTNDNGQCKLVKETRLCNIRPCSSLALPAKKGRKCSRTHKAPEPQRLSLAGCRSVRLYRPNYCGVCVDGRCCSPRRTRTAPVTFACPDGERFQRSVMFVQSCKCSEECDHLNDVALPPQRWLHGDTHKFTD
ncbi:CCN family member 1 [Osmerus mordax]|uniref:CCN family member 1 n=1 Tax=Osmerus mordax TaxID=8014 RepID=UPI0035101E7F